MNTIVIATRLSVGNALLLGQTHAGDGEYQPDASEIAQLSDAERSVLITHARIDGEHAPNVPRLSVASNSWTGIVEALRLELEAKQKLEREKELNFERLAGPRRVLLARDSYYLEDTMPPQKTRAFANLPWVSSFDSEELRKLDEQVNDRAEKQRQYLIRKADARLKYELVNDQLSPEIQAVLRACREGGRGVDYLPIPENALKFKERFAEEQSLAAEARVRENLKKKRDVLLDFGTAGQLERFDAGVLPPDELNEIISRYLFSPFPAVCALYEEISEQEVAAELECHVDEVVFSTKKLDNPTLDEMEWIRFKSVRDQMSEVATIADAGSIEIREHIGYVRGFASDNDPDVRKRSIRVTIAFAGDKYRRDFAL